ncbi:GNAT family N-acetyltransferase [Heyndrickxia sp. NPDC080065]|uniref:GNAT family N-acetyltransferase n=1 Tax=Heyndrickxia sp. NPDC080065 TaxID=3390568 RepID=UPI003D08D183
METNIFISEKVKLAALLEEDLEKIPAWYNDTEFAHLFDALPAAPKTKSQLDKWYESFSDSNSQYLFAIKTVNTNEFIGYIEVSDILWNHRVGWLAIAIGEKNQRGNGYGYESLKQALNFAFYELNLHRVQLTVFSYNKPAIALYKKLGFQQEGIYREFIHRNGETHDMLLFGLLKREWESRTENNEK